MNKCSLFVSLLFLLLSATAVAQSADSSEYNVVMQARGYEFTGVCVMDISPEDDVVGTIVNEFGVKAFDFTYDAKTAKAKVLNVIKPLNKWYVRKVLRGDVSFLLSNIHQQHDVTSKKRLLTWQPDGGMTLSNDRYKLYYTFTHLKSE